MNTRIKNRHGATGCYNTTLVSSESCRSQSDAALSLAEYQFIEEWAVFDRICEVVFAVPAQQRLYTADTSLRSIH